MTVPVAVAAPSLRVVVHLGHPKPDLVFPTYIQLTVFHFPELPAKSSM
jgi:hypothetical protein